MGWWIGSEIWEQKDSMVFGLSNSIHTVFEINSLFKII